MFQSFMYMHEAYNKVIDQGVFTESGVNYVHNTDVVLQNTVKILGKQLGGNVIPSLGGKSKTVS